MGMETGETHRVFQGRIDASGRIVIPADTRLRHKVREGDTILLEEDSVGTLHLRTLDDAIREAQEYFCVFVSPGVSIVDELIAERREEAARE